MITQVEWGLIAVALAFTAHFKGRFKNAAPAVVFLGILAVGTSGRIVGLVARFLAFVMGLIGKLGAQILGYSAATIILVAVVVALFLFLHDMHPKHSAGRGTFWLAVGLAVVISAGLTPIAALNQLPAQVQQGVSTTSGG